MLFVAVYRGSLDEILSGYFLLAVIGATLGDRGRRVPRFPSLVAPHPRKARCAR